ncbi:CHAT domain-containing tetratricopeptide repeat protein [Dactylosporangium sp. NPDC005555]|uniref:CHAT domain-containing tetratricopeptide repeat protein n=1 Tax=Dactylosporangium sp. NPDC005555 TaxID=3154889 RepID=UPI00339DF489
MQDEAADRAVAAMQALTGEDGDLDTLDEALRTLGGTLATTEGEAHWDHFLALVGGMRLRYDLSGDPGDLDAMVRAVRDATDAAPDDSLPDLRFHAMSALWERFLLAGDPADLADAVGNARWLMALDIDDELITVTVPSELADMLAVRYSFTGDPADLDEAVTLRRRILAALPAGHELRVRLELILGNTLRLRFERGGRRADLDEAVAVLQQAMDVVPDDDPAHDGGAYELSVVLVKRFLADRALPDLDAAVGLVRDLDGSQSRNALSQALGIRFEVTGDPADLDAAVDAGRDAVALLEEGHHDWSVFRNSLAGLLRTRAATGTPADLDEAVDLHREAVAAASPEHPFVPQLLVNLARTLRARSAAGDLDEAVDALRLAAAVTGHPRRAASLTELGWALLARYATGGALGDLAEAVAVGRSALDLEPAGSPGLLVRALTQRYDVTADIADLDDAITLWRPIAAAPAELHGLGGVLWARFEATGAPADRDEAIELVRRAVAAAPDGPDAVRFRLEAGSALRRRFAATGRVADLDEAVECVRGAARVDPLDADVWAALSDLTMTRFGSTGRREDLDTAVGAAEAALRFGPDDEDLLAERVQALAHALRTRFEHFGDEADRDAARVLERDAGIGTDPMADLVGPSDGDAYAYLRGGQGAELLERVLAGGDPAVLDTAIGLLQQAVDLFSPGAEGRTESMSDLATALWCRSVTFGDPADLDRAITAGRAAVAGGPSPARVGLANALLSRFTRFGALSDVDESVAVARSAVEVADDGRWGSRAGALSGLGIALRLRYAVTQDPADIAEAVTAGRAAVDAAQDDQRAIPLANLVGTLLLRFERHGARADLDEAVTAGRAAVAATAAGHPDRAAPMANLATALRHRAEWTRSPADVDEAVAVGRAAVEATPAGHGDLPMYRSNLALALRQRYLAGGDRADLDGAVAAARAAVAGFAEDHPDRPRYLSNLTVHLRNRYFDLGDPADLAEAVRLGREALAAAGPAGPERATLLTNLGATLGVAATAGREPGDADRTAQAEAVELARAAVDVALPGHPSRPMYLGNLATALYDTFLTDGDPAALDEAVTLARAAAGAAAPGHQDRDLHLILLNKVLLAKIVEGAGELVDEAVAVAREALAAAPTAHARDALADSLQRRFARTADPTDLDAALDLWRAVAGMATATPQERIAAGARAGALAAAHGQWDRAVDAYAVAVAMMPFVAWRGSVRSSRERLLRRWAGIAAEACACAIAAGLPDRAVELLEHGRGVLWSQLLETRADITALRQAAPALAARVDAVRAALNLAEDGAIDRRMNLAVQWDALVRQARALPGFEDFLRSPGVERLRAAAAGGTVVLLNAAAARCDALLVGADGTRVISLPGLDAAAVAARADAYLAALLAVEAGDIFAELDIDATLRWLWDDVAGPVLAALPPGHTRVWWCPTGPFSFLPVHAAGHHDEGAGRTVLDRVVSSYTPTLRSLLQARTADAPPADSRMLVVALPATPGLPPLPNVTRERDLLTALFPAARRTVREGPAATRAEVRAALGRHAWAHFSCHGDQQLGDPSRGGLALHDGMLTIAELAGDRFGGEFAFLSACKTAVGGVHNPDEAISLVAALQYTGWRHVIGTLWTVWDDAAATVAEDVYRTVVVHGELRPDTAAAALHAATRRRRDADPARPSTWAPFVHIGP